MDETDIAFGYPPAGIPEQEVARGCMLRGNLPNPFTTTTTIRYDLARSEAIVLSIHSVDGREVVTLAEGTMPAGNHQVDWSGRDAAGQPLPSGVYLVRLRLEEAAVSRRLLLLR